MHKHQKISEMRAEIVSGEGMIFSADVTCLVVPGVSGELGIFPGHSALLTTLIPGTVRIDQSEKDSRFLYVSGGILEVQPFAVTVLADTAMRSEAIDARAVRESRHRAQRLVSHATGLGYLEAKNELTQALAQLKTLDQARKKRRSRHS